MTRLAATKAKHAAGTSSAAQALANGAQIVAFVTNNATYWTLGGVVVITPTISADAPANAWSWLERRALCALVGTCPTCHAAATVTRSGRASITHQAWCDLDELPAAHERWFS